MRQVVIFLLCTLAAAGTASAADHLLLAGTQWARLGGYSYVGVLTPVGQGSFGNGWVMRHWLDRLTYQYDGSQPNIHAQSYGYSPALGYQGTRGNTRVGIYGAVRIAHTDLSPDDLSNADRGTHGRFSIQGEASTPLGTALENQLIAQVEIGNGGYFVRDRVVLRFLRSYTMGPEVAFKGNSEYSAWQAGLTFGGISLGERTRLLLGAGVNRQHTQSSEGYANIEFAVSF
jgi:hypothetical protein